MCVPQSRMPLAALHVFFLQKWIDFVAGLAAFLCTWVLASPVEEFVVSKTLITLV